ncbi:hypothetical protein BC940DRAFT_333430 [Gongronella butleri]|nr:hypothetical protein BC940DRAFT_333430 [Gongronella butleri]
MLADGKATAAPPPAPPPSPTPFYAQTWPTIPRPIALAPVTTIDPINIAMTLSPEDEALTFSSSLESLSSTLSETLSSMLSTSSTSSSFSDEDDDEDDADESTFLIDTMPPLDLPPLEPEILESTPFFPVLHNDDAHREATLALDTPTALMQEKNHDSMIPQPRTRQLRDNSDHLRMLVAEVNMMRSNKLICPLRQRAVLPERLDAFSHCKSPLRHSILAHSASFYSST